MNGRAPPTTDPIAEHRAKCEHGAECDAYAVTKRGEFYRILCLRRGCHLFVQLADGLMLPESQEQV